MSYDQTRGSIKNKTKLKLGLKVPFEIKEIINMDINHLRFMVSGFQVWYSRLRFLRYMVEDEKFLRLGGFFIMATCKDGSFHGNTCSQ